MCGENILKERNAGRLRKTDVRVEGCGIVIKGRRVGMTVTQVPRMTERTTEKLLFCSSVSFAAKWNELWLPKAQGHELLSLPHSGCLGSETKERLHCSWGNTD